MCNIYYNNTYIVSSRNPRTCSNYCYRLCGDMHNTYDYCNVCNILSHSLDVDTEY